MPITFKEALAWAKSRKVVLPTEYDKILPKRLKEKAFTIAGLASQEQLQFVLDSLTSLLEDGGTFESWQKMVLEGKFALKLPLHRLDNIFRTNMQVHYNRGHWVQQQEHKTQRPFLMYDAVNDNRVRPTHLRLDGVIKPVDDPFWEIYYPSNGYRCRCSTIALTAKQAEARGGITPDPPNGWPEVDEGWGYNTGKDPDHGIRRVVEQQSGSTVLQKALLTRLQNGR